VAEEKPKKKKFTRDGLKKASRIFRYVKPYAWQFTLGLVLISLSSVFTLLVTRLWGQLGGVGTGATGPATAPELVNFNLNLADLQSIILAIFAVLVIQAALSYLRVIIFANVTENMMLNLRRDTFERIVAMPMQYFNEQRVGDLNSRISADITSIQDVFTTTLVELLRQMIIIVGGIVALLYFSPVLTAIMLSTLPVMMIVAVVFGRFIRKLSKATQDKVADSNVVVQETLTGIVNVKSFANEMLEIGRYMHSITDIRSYALRGAKWRGAFASFIILFIFGAISIVIYKGAELMQTGELGSEHFFTFLLMTGLVAGSIGGIASQFGVLQKGIGAIENVMDMLEMEPEPVTLHPPVRAKTKNAPLHGEVAFKNVTFQYASRPDVTVLQDLSFTVHAGKQVAIVGSSGAGKSTIASLVLQFYKPTSGEVLFDGLTAGCFELTELRNQMAYVPQEVILFGGSIRENIAYGKPEASEEEIQMAAAQANALDFINQFPDGFDTVVGDRGIQLSGGQRQRIAIARAVLKNPTVLILDEATSSLDSESERLVQDALDKLMQNRTSIVIAHRLSTIQNADQIFVLDQGRVAEAGTHSALLDQGGLYRQLVYGKKEREDLMLGE
jgi:ABC-type multidrug transport system fused ATPase/permease subunit